jgi:penicillin-binding protein-related factor A (putative recombinase)
MDDLEGIDIEDPRIPPPAKLGAKEFETLVLAYARKYGEARRLFTLGRYGVMSNFIKGQWMPVPSLPDFEGVMAGGRQFIFDTKVCSQSAYDLSGGTSKSFKHQYKHMQRRAKFGAVCFVLIHYNERVLKTKTDPAMTIAIPIHDKSDLWEAYDKGEQKSITRLEAELYGVPVGWMTPLKKVLPELNDMLNTLIHKLET